MKPLLYSAVVVRDGREDKPSKYAGYLLDELLQELELCKVESPLRGNLKSITITREP